jgi:hypothetical protein
VGVEVDELLMHLIKVLVEIFGEFLEQLLDDVGGGSHGSSDLRIPVYQCKSPIGVAAGGGGWRWRQRERERESWRRRQRRKEGAGRGRGSAEREGEVGEGVIVLLLLD